MLIFIREQGIRVINKCGKFGYHSMFPPLAMIISVRCPSKEVQPSWTQTRPCLPEGPLHADEGLASSDAYASVALFISFLLNTGALGGRPI
jgi:hypothetical protein